MPKPTRLDVDDIPAKGWGDPAGSAIAFAEDAVLKAAGDRLEQLSNETAAVFFNLKPGLRQALNAGLIATIKTYLVQAFEDGDLWLSPPADDGHGWKICVGAYEQMDILATWSLKAALDDVVRDEIDEPERLAFCALLEEALARLK